MRFSIPLLLVLLSSSTITRAEPLRRPALHWVRAEGAEGCIDPRALSERVQALTGPVLVRSADCDISIEGEVRPLAPKGFRARITVSNRNGDVQGERTLDEKSEDCHAFDAAVAFVIAITIDPSVELPEDVAAAFANERAPEQALLEELEREPPKPVIVEAAVETRAAPRTPQEKPKAPAVQKPTRVWEGAIGASFASGVLPSSVYGAWLALHRSVSVFAFGASVRASQTDRAPLEQDSSMSLDAYEGALSACLVPTVGKGVALRGCLGPEASVLVAQGNDFDVNHKKPLTALGIALAPALQVAVWQRLSLRVEGLLRLNLRRPTFTYLSEDTGEQTAFRVSRFASSVLLGAVISF